eukprot:TRINITY_DN2219_c0_g1_i7.p1 TRINITY_DN2219_c0_g1~~TRINITY_DN2219_c0_g1_i7.p1  ORF type:complete len:273 (+),score=-12.51 TRINITY_DN2219_c0_g1_i7:1002-1820(+)
MLKFSNSQQIKIKLMKICFQSNSNQLHHRIVQQLQKQFRQLVQFRPNSKTKCNIRYASLLKRYNFLRKYVPKMGTSNFGGTKMSQILYKMNNIWQQIIIFLQSYTIETRFLKKVPLFKDTVQQFTDFMIFFFIFMYAFQSNIIYHYQIIIAKQHLLINNKINSRVIESLEQMQVCTIFKKLDKFCKIIEITKSIQKSSKQLSTTFATKEVEKKIKICSQPQKNYSKLINKMQSIFKKIIQNFSTKCNLYLKKLFKTFQQNVIYIYAFYSKKK